MTEAVTIHPADSEHWSDLVRLFGERGACGGCWCMYWRVPKKEYEANKGAGNRRAIKRLIEAGRKPGLIAWVGEEPVGWCSIAPRVEYRHLETSRILKPVDDEAVWSVVCFFIEKSHRRLGLARKLLEAAVDFAASRGATIIEGYPVEPAKTTADVFVYTGLASTFRAVGFIEVARRSATRPIMRYDVRKRQGSKSRQRRSARRQRA